MTDHTHTSPVENPVDNTGRPGRPEVSGPTRPDTPQPPNREENTTQNRGCPDTQPKNSPGHPDFSPIFRGVRRPALKGGVRPGHPAPGHPGTGPGQGHGDKQLQPHEPTNERTHPMSTPTVSISRNDSGGWKIGRAHV